MSTPSDVPDLPNFHVPAWTRDAPADAADELVVAVAGSGEPPTEPVAPDDLRAAIVAALKTVYDPEIPVDIYELGLIYEIVIDAETGKIGVRMTLTAPACPVAGTLPQDVADKVASVSGVSRAEVELVWDPPWSMERISEAARLELGFL
ncbi:SUF system Fe-S cluster assembly protein [Haliangium sp.]|uniref:SUF system Fe-S cluster assembly protein n=1 Tax=Haliangium sp. TaxID=2663208 RepID=UPI003D0AA7E5